MGMVSHERALWLSRYILPHEPALRTWLKLKGTTSLDSDDVVQETYAKLTALESVETIRNPKTYFFQVAYSVVVSHVRRSRIVSIDAAINVENLRCQTDEPSPEQQIADRQELQRIAEAIASLPARSQQVLMLRRIEGLSQREVAQRLDLSENSVEHHMGRAIRLLMDIFGRGGKTPSRASNPISGTSSQSHGPAGSKSSN